MAIYPLTDTTNSPIDQVYFNDGEGLDHTDLNLLQDKAKVGLQDGFWAQIAKASEASEVPSTSYLFAPSITSARPEPSVTLVVPHSVGTLCQQTDTLDGDGLAFASFFLSDNMLPITFSAYTGTVGWARWDTVWVKIDHVATSTESRDFKDASTSALTTTTPAKDYKPRLTWTVVEGTPAASASAVESATAPAGYVKWYAVKILHSVTTVTFDRIRDYRIPFQTKQYDIPAHQLTFNPTDWEPNSVDIICQDHPSSPAVRSYAPASGRVLSISLVSAYNGAGDPPTITLNKYYMDGSVATAGVAGINQTTIDSELQPTTDGDLQLKSTSLLATPVWTTGDQNSYPNSSVSKTQLVYIPHSSGSTDHIVMVRWVIAG
jgi:hypothetical protein